MGKKWAIKEGDPREKQGKTHALALRAVCLNECSLNLGVAQASDTLTVPTEACTNGSAFATTPQKCAPRKFALCDCPRGESLKRSVFQLPGLFYGKSW